MQVLPNFGNEVRSLALSSQSMAKSEEMALICVVLLDEHTLVREGVSQLIALEPDMRVVALSMHATGGELVAAVRGAEYPLKRLSPRERQVLKLVVDGNTNGSVAASLGVRHRHHDCGISLRARM